MLIVVPCYNEEKRLNPDQFLEALDRHPEMGWVFVNDGSTDGTAKVLDGIKFKAPDRVFVVDYGVNRGKGEAVRQGLLYALSQSAQLTGYFDADLATPISELERLMAIHKERGHKVTMGSRVFLLGRNIERKPWRYILGRVFAVIASRIVRLKVYDTQCGTKLIDGSSELKKCLTSPFLSSWLFDVELIRRLMRDGQYKATDFYEEPLRQWSDVGGSKVKFRSLLTAIWDLWKIATAPEQISEESSPIALNPKPTHSK